MAALSLADVRWRSRRDPAGGTPLVHVTFLAERGDRRAGAVVAGVAGYVASLAGRPRREYDPDVPAEIAGDRRLGHGLAGVCQDWYRWRGRTFAEALPVRVAAALAANEVDHPSALRLRLFDLVNETGPGFVPAAQREEMLGRLAVSLTLDPGDGGVLDVALTLDHEDEAVLEPVGEPPSLAEVVARYNRALLAALLRQAERVVFTLQEPDGALIRRLYSLCRRLGVYCDVEAADALAAVRAARGPVPLGGGIRLTLAGPDAVVGPPAAAGPRLATVALRLLRGLGPDDGGVAHLVLRERRYRLALDRALLRVPGLEEPADLTPRPLSLEGRGSTDGDSLLQDWAGGQAEHPPTPDSQLPTPSYDSEIEARLAREFGALARQGRAAGWRLVREPAPLLAGRRVLIPDFALVRGALRVFVEVAGFWTPGYIAKKREALELLSADVPLVLAVAEPQAAALEGLPFPLLPYRDAVPVHALLALAEERYGDFADRTSGAAERLAAAAQAAASCGWLPEARLAAALGCHSAGEVMRVLAGTPLPAGWSRVPGVGLYGAVLRDALCAALERAWAERPDASFTAAGVRALLPHAALPDSDDALVALLDTLPACAIMRGSLFEVEVRLPGYAGAPPVQPAAPGPSAEGNRARPAKAASRPRRSAPAMRPPALF